MSVWTAVFWGAFSSASLFIGQALAAPLRDAHKATGLLMGFGAGTLLSAVAYELVPLSSLSHGVGIGVGFALGALTYYVLDRIVDRRGGGDRQDIDIDRTEGTGAAMFIGALLDGVPESFVLGASIALGGEISIAFVVAIFVSNIPQGVAGTASLRVAGTADRRITMAWGMLTLACAATAAVGFVVSDALPDGGLYAQAFAAGAVLTMLADSMMPEAFEHGGRAVGLLTVLGYAVAAALTLLE